MGLNKFATLILIAVTMLALSPVLACATGLSDFEIDLGEGYWLYSPNDLDVCIVRNGSPLILGSSADGVGPVVQYHVTPTHIYTRNAGRSYRALFPGDTFETSNYAVSFYFILDKRTRTVTGPLTQAAFDTDPAVIDTTIDWQNPSNPNLSILGKLLLLGAGLTVSAVVMIMLVYVACNRLSKRQLRKSAPPPSTR